VSVLKKRAPVVFPAQILAGWLAHKIVLLFGFTWIDEGRDGSYHLRMLNLHPFNNGSQRAGKLAPFPIRRTGKIFVNNLFTPI
jgi:hypothetical protein